MKLRLALLSTFFNLFITSHGAPVNSSDFETCQTEYDTIIGQLVASSGMNAASTVWKILFQDLDLDGNGQLTSSELALSLEKENYIHRSDIMDVMKQATDWIKVSDVTDGQLDRDEFISVVRTTIGKKSELSSSDKFPEITKNLCKFFTKKIPHLSETMTDLSKCTANLEKAIFSDKSQRAKINSWSAIFKTIDSNTDNRINIDEVKEILGSDYQSEDEDTALTKTFGSVVSSSSETRSLSQTDFYALAHKILFGKKGSNRKDSWGDITSEDELRGRMLMCKSISDVRNTLLQKRHVMEKCKSHFAETRDTLLGADGIFTPEIVFTMADEDKNGEISESEFRAFIGTHSALLFTLQRAHDVLHFKIKEFKTLMPDQIVVAKDDNETNDVSNKTDVSAVLESSLMSSAELDDAESLCISMMNAVKRFPDNDVSNSDVIGHDVMNYQTAPNMRFSGDQILLEHTLPPGEEEEPLDVPTELPEEIIPAVNPNALPSDKNTSVMYRIIGADGIPFTLNLKGIEIDDISHRIAMAQQQQPPPEEPLEGEPLEQSGISQENGKPLEHQAEPESESSDPVQNAKQQSAEGESVDPVEAEILGETPVDPVESEIPKETPEKDVKDLVTEIEGIIKESPGQRTPEEERANDLVKEIENHEDGDIPPSTGSEQNLTAEERELQELLEIMEKEKLKSESEIIS